MRSLCTINFKGINGLQPILNYLHCVLSLFIFLIFIYLASSSLSCGKLDLCCGTRACGIFSCSMHVGSSSLTRDPTQTPCIGSMDSQPMDHQGSPCIIFRRGLLFFPFNCQAYKGRDGKQLHNSLLEMWEGGARTIRRKTKIGTGILTALAKNK